MDLHRASILVWLLMTLVHCQAKDRLARMDGIIYLIYYLAFTLSSHGQTWIILLFCTQIKLICVWFSSVSIKSVLFKRKTSGVHFYLLPTSLEHHIKKEKKEEKGTSMEMNAFTNCCETIQMSSHFCSWSLVDGHATMQGHSFWILGGCSTGYDEFVKFFFFFFDRYNEFVK